MTSRLQDVHYILFCVVIVKMRSKNYALRCITSYNQNLSKRYQRMKVIRSHIIAQKLYFLLITVFFQFHWEIAVFNFEITAFG